MKDNKRICVACNERVEPHFIVLLTDKDGTLWNEAAICQNCVDYSVKITVYNNGNLE